MKKRIGYLPDYSVNNFLNHFYSNFPALLLCKIKVFDIFIMVDCFKDFIISRSTEILIKSNFG